MSSSSTAMTAHAASTKKIANYTQSISTGVTNLLTEIGRVSASAAPASASGTDAAILLQLQALTGQIVGLVNRMDEVQRMVGGLEKRLDDMASSSSDIRWELAKANHIPVSENLFSDEYVRENLCKAFGLRNDRHETLDEFIGVGAEIIENVTLNGIHAETLALIRIKKTSQRELACKAAGPPTVKTREAAEIHNKKARAHNKQSRSFRSPIIPIHDSRNIPVKGFPTTFGTLTSPLYQANILYFLREYEQDVGTDCLGQWFEFVGVDTEHAFEALEYEAYIWLE
ncbi:hypothetical protein Q9L58_005642 [Maublancomyces gigas]|uniref:Uncharacterized protein n=1 Tax=Discina gigas TaxID=1032678 RepID=A0ABR3GHM6_9PEZI